MEAIYQYYKFPCRSVELDGICNCLLHGPLQTQHIPNHDRKEYLKKFIEYVESTNKSLTPLYYLHLCREYLGHSEYDKLNEKYYFQSER